ncbi:hypothetical protein FOL47_006389, partial [Perkinsus chesapeaki]
MAYNYRDNYEDWDPKYNYNKDKTNYSGYNNNYYYGKDYSSGNYYKNGNDLGSAVNKDDIDKLLNMGSGSVTTSITTTRTLRRQVFKGDHMDSYDDESERSGSLFGVSYSQLSKDIKYLVTTVFTGVLEEDEEIAEANVRLEAIADYGRWKDVRTVQNNYMRDHSGRLGREKEVCCCKGCVGWVMKFHVESWERWE